MRFFLIQATLGNWYTYQIDVVVACVQAPVERVLYLEIPKGVHVEGTNCKNYVLKLLKFLFGKKATGHVWYNHFIEFLKLSSIPNTVDECTFYYNKSINLTFKDNSILSGTDEHDLINLKQLIAKMFDIQKEKETFEINLESKSKERKMDP